MNHSFDVDLAVEYGINAAIIFQSIAWWCSHSRANDVHFHDGYYWTYNSNRAFQELFPYMSSKQISNAIDKLVSDGLIVKGNYNKSAYDRTLWYAVTEKGERISQKGKMEESKQENGNVKNGEPIPVISTIISTDISNTVVVDNKDARARVREETDNNDDNDNPFGDGGPDHPTETLASYAANNIMNMNGRNMEFLLGYTDILPEQVIRYAIDLANKCCRSGVPTYKYLERILTKYVSQKIQTVEQAQALEAARDAEKERGTRKQAVGVVTQDNRLLNAPWY